MELPADTHVHSEWSWEPAAPTPMQPRMAAMCAQAVRVGVSTIAFTEHLDFDDRWRTDPEDLLLQQQQKYLSEDGYLVIPPLDVHGYLDCIDRCRHRFRDLRILTGVEFGQPHLWEAEARGLVDLDALDRVNGSLHTLLVGRTGSNPARSSGCGRRRR